MSEGGREGQREGDTLDCNAIAVKQIRRRVALTKLKQTSQ